MPVGDEDDGAFADPGRNQAVHELPDGRPDGQRRPLCRSGSTVSSVCTSHRTTVHAYKQFLELRRHARR